MSKVTNTSKHEVHPEWTGGGNPRAIEDQEARGQAELVNSEVLPASCGGREKLEAAGVVFGSPVDGDPLFVHAALPDGWKKRPTEHSMWSDLIDAEGKVRANIFYKAAFYDRKAHMNATE